MTVAIELPDTLTEQSRQISEKEIEAVAIAALEIRLAQRSANQTENGGRFSESAVSFVRRFIPQNEEWFEIVARRQ